MITAPAGFTTANAALAKKPIFLIDIEGYWRSFVFIPSIGGVKLQEPTGQQVDWLVSIDDHTTTVDDLSGGANLSELVFTVQDRKPVGSDTGAITADFPLFIFEGKKATLKTGFVGMAEGDYALLFTGKISSVISTNDNTEYKFVTDDPRQELAKVIFTLGDDGKPTDSKHPRTINDHPINILIDILEVELGILPADIDLAKLTQYRDTIYSGVNFQFRITSPPQAGPFIENELMKPLGAYLRVNNLGQITADFFYPILPQTVFSFDDDNLIDLPQAGQADLINEVSLRFDYDDQDKPLSEEINEDGDSITKYGLFGQHVIEAKGVRSGFNGFFLASLVSGLIFLRYGDKQLTFDASALWTACVLEPGDFVLVSSPKVPDRTLGVMGITNKAFVLLDRTWHFMDCTVTFKFLAFDLALFKQFLITPDSEPHYVAASTTDEAKYMFMCNDSDQYSNGAPGNTLG